MNINLYDAQNWCRIKMETAYLISGPRTVYNHFAESKDFNILVWDGLRGNARRRKVYPPYKVWDRSKIKHVYEDFDFIRQILELTPVLQVRHPDYEADDVIATMVRRFAKDDQTVTIYSNDADYLQLVHEFPGRVFCGAKPKCEPHLTRYYKTCVGDPSDKIPGIAGFGKGTWDYLRGDCVAKWVDQIVATGKVPYLEGLPKRVKVDPELVRTFWSIVGFFNVPMSEIETHTKSGVPNPAAAGAIMGSYMQ